MINNFLRKFKVPVLWNIDNIHFNWTVNYALGQIPEGDQWNIKATTGKLETERLFRDWGIENPSTKHYHSYNTVLDFDITKIYENIPGINHHHVFLKLGPGMTIPWHQDVYSYYINQYKIQDEHTAYRALILLEDWNPGQVIQYGDEVIYNWKAGDSLTWNRDLWHGGANFGNKSLIVMMINYQNYENTNMR